MYLYRTLPHITVFVAFECIITFSCCIELCLTKLHSLTDSPLWFSLKLEGVSFFFPFLIAIGVTRHECTVVLPFIDASIECIVALALPRIVRAILHFYAMLYSHCVCVCGGGILISQVIVFGGSLQCIVNFKCKCLWLVLNAHLNCVVIATSFLFITNQGAMLASLRSTNPVYYNSCVSVSRYAR